ncbi:PUR family DNA/RNA-binding protein [Capnocytophaga canimorsus]|nr:PUR family DNA/RNA-binding protein [Capnocytophaga canimorsus]WGU71575.1 PUR family DNA/RNA-binding protein [Capnocytophaga canimorsus]
MEENNFLENEDIFSKVLRAGRRTYFFDVRATRAGDYYLTITESKKFTEDNGAFHYKKHKIYLYKEDFESFKEILAQITSYVFEEKGEEVISERHQKDFKKRRRNRLFESSKYRWGGGGGKLLKINNLSGFLFF